MPGQLITTSTSNDTLSSSATESPKSEIKRVGGGRQRIAEEQLVARQTVAFSGAHVGRFQHVAHAGSNMAQDHRK